MVNFVRMVALMDGLPKMALLHLLLLSSLLPTAFSLLAEGPKDLLVASGSPASLSNKDAASLALNVSVGSAYNTSVLLFRAGSVWALWISAPRFPTHHAVTIGRGPLAVK